MIITTHDRPLLLRRCLASVLAQTRPATEIIVVDDCSELPAASALAGMEQDAPQLEVLRLDTPGGAQAARNLGAGRATGDVLMFLDDDDRWTPEKLAAQMHLFETRPEVGWVYTGMQALDERGGAEKLLHKSARHASGRVWPEILFRNFAGPTSAVAVRRALFHEVGGFDPALRAMQDYDLWIRLARAAPALHDGAHHLLFAARIDTPGRLSRNIDNYYAAAAYLIEKYRPHVRALPAAEARMRSNLHILLASKHYDRNELPGTLACLARAVRADPGAALRIARFAGRGTLAAFARALKLGRPATDDPPQLANDSSRLES